MALLEAAPSVSLVDATDLFHKVRLQRDQAERSLFAKADAIAHDCLAQISMDSIAEPHRLVGAIEKAARDARAEEVYVTLAPDLHRSASFLRVDRAQTIGAAFAIRLSLGYKSTWVRRTRSVSTDAAIATQFARLDAAFGACAAQADGKRALGSDLAAHLSEAGASKLQSWSLECCRASYPLEIVAGDGVGEASALQLSAAVLTAEARFDGLRWIGSLPLQHV